MNNSTHSIDQTIGLGLDVRFTDIFNLEEIQRMQDLFSDATGVASIITYPDGTPITRLSNFCRLCNDIIRKTEKGCANCFKSDAFIGGHNPLGPTLQPCLSGGLWDAGVSITIENKHIGNWLIGQIRTEETDDQHMLKYAEEIGAEKKDFLEALNEVPVMSIDRFKKVADMLFVYANDLSDRIYKNIQLQQQIAEREKMNEALLKSEEALSITLHSIGDGVISTDKNGLIVNMNPVAEHLCGWKLADAIEKPLVEVFNIINASSRKVVENPVEKVLESGKIIGLANHTILISRDNSEYHIADSAAPIKNNEDLTSGVVLVFSDITEKHIAEDKLIESERSKSVLLENLPGMAYRCKFDRNWTKEFVSKGCVELTGYQISDFINNQTISFNDLILPEYREHLWDVWQKATLNKEIVREEYKIRTADNRIKWVWEQGIPIYNKKGEVEALEGIIIDISERKQIEEALRESEEKYRNIFENVQDVFYQVDMEGNFFEVSPSIKNFVGYEPDEIIGSPIERLYACATDRRITLDNLLKNGQVTDYEIDFKTRSGIIRHASLNAQLIYDDKGNPVHIDGFIRDLTQRKLADKALRESENKFHDYIEYSPHGIFVANEFGNYIEVNRAATEITGYSKDELLTLNQTDLISPDSFIPFENHFIKVVSDGFASDEFELIKKDESRIYVTFDTVKLSEHLFLVFVVDVTYRKKAEEELKESEVFLKETQLIANLGNCIIDINSGTWKSSEVLDSIFGIESDFDKSFESLGLIIHPEWRIMMTDYFMHHVVENKFRFDKKFKIIRQIDTEVRWVHAIGELKMDNENTPVKLIATVQDITERKEAAEALRESESLHRSILKASPDAIIVVEMDGSIRVVSPVALSLYGCEREELLIGKNMFEFIAPEDLERAESNTMLMFGGYMGAIEYRILRLNGISFFAEVNGDFIWSTDGQPIGMVFIIRDITDRKSAENELKSSQEQLKKFASHLQSIREEERILLAREIHDELGQILIAIKIDLGMMKQKVLKSIKKTDAENFLINFDNLFGLVDNTIKTTRKIMTDLRPEVLYLLGFIEAVKLHINKFQERHNIECSFKSSVPDLDLNIQQSLALFRILQESLTNVVKHAQATATNIQLYTVEEKLVLKISDNGIGIIENHTNKHDSYGLIGMKERVFLLDGELIISSQSGKGTTVKVEMPYQRANSIKNS